MSGGVGGRGFAEGNGDTGAPGSVSHVTPGHCAARLRLARHCVAAVPEKFSKRGFAP